KKTVLCVFSYDADRDAIFGIGAGEAVLHVDVFSLQVGQNLLAQLVEVGLLKRAVRLAPPNVFLRRSLAHNELIVRRASGVLPRVDDQRPEVRDVSFAAPDAVLVQFPRAQIPIGAVKIFEAMIFQTVRTWVPT